VRLQPSTQGNVLCVAQLRGGDLFAAKIFRPLNASGGAHDQGCSAAGGTSNDAQGLTLGTHIAGDGRIRSDISQIKRSGEQSFNHGRPGIENSPFDLRTRSKRMLEPAGGSPDQGLRMRHVRKIARAYCDADTLRARWTGRQEEEKIVNGMRDRKRLLRSPGPTKSSLFALAFKNSLLGENKKPTCQLLLGGGSKTFQLEFKSLDT